MVIPNMVAKFKNLDIFYQISSIFDQSIKEIVWYTPGFGSQSW